MRKLFFWATIISGGVAAYLMLKRGESLGTVGRQATVHPFGSLVNELKRV